MNLDRDNLNVRPWPVDPNAEPLNPSFRTRGGVYNPPLAPARVAVWPIILICCVATYVGAADLIIHAWAKMHKRRPDTSISTGETWEEFLDRQI